MQQTFCGRLIEAAEQRPNKIAMTLLGPSAAETTSFGSMLSQIRSLAYRLSVEGIAFGERVALIGENHPNWAIAYLAILYRGAVAVPLDPAATVETLANFLENSESRLAFVSPSSVEKFHLVCEHLGKGMPTVCLQALTKANGSASLADWANTATPPEFDAAPTPATAGDTALLIYTSGTTGQPKAVPLTHGNIYAEVEGVQEVMKLTDREVILSLLPLFHAYSQIVNLWLATIIGARVVYLNEVTSDEIARGLRQGGVTALTGVPRLWYLFHKKVFDAVRTQPRPVRLLFKSMLTANGKLRDSLGINLGRILFRRVHQGFGGKLRLAVSAGSSFDAEVARDYHRLGFTILQGYGLTETAGAATVTRFEDNKVGSVGTPLNNVEVRVDEPNEEGIGEVLIRGPIVMTGYYKNPEANREAFTADGWLRSGDLGRFDRDGHLYIVGRKKDVIVLPSGKNVYPEDVEAHYARSPLVGEICVLGITNSDGFAASEKLCAVVVPDFEYLKVNRIANAREAIRFDLDNLGRELPGYQRVR
ncbi:MAG: AMP-dependent synthetase/ligase, partial [Pyrinomonadaceae bacterium]